MSTIILFLGPDRKMTTILNMWVDRIVIQHKYKKNIHLQIVRNNILCAFCRTDAVCWAVTWIHSSISCPSTMDSGGKTDLREQKSTTAVNAVFLLLLFSLRVVCLSTCTNRGIVCMLAISPLLMGSLAMMWSAPVQPSTISSIRTPSCTERGGERRTFRVF